jgi:hypothetical protein
VYRGRAVDYVDTLPDGSEPLIEVRGQPVAAGHYRSGREYFVQIGRQYRRLTHTRSGNGWMVRVRTADGERIAISWTD